MELTYTYRQYKQNPKDNIPESDLLITVDYNPTTEEVEQIISVTAFDHDSRSLTDLTAIFHECLNLDEIVDEINWPEVYAGEVMA